MRIVILNAKKGALRGASLDIASVGLACSLPLICRRLIHFLFPFTTKFQFLVLVTVALNPRWGSPFWKFMPFMLSPTLIMFLESSAVSLSKKTLFLFTSK
jgi:hypothetical protein